MSLIYLFEPVTEDKGYIGTNSINVKTGEKAHRMLFNVESDEIINVGKHIINIQMKTKRNFTFVGVNTTLRQFVKGVFKILQEESFFRNCNTYEKIKILFNIAVKLKRLKK